MLNGNDPQGPGTGIGLALHDFGDVVLEFLAEHIASFLPEGRAARCIDQIHHEGFPPTPQSVR